MDFFVTPSPNAPEPQQVQELFDRLAYRYDFFNQCASFGLDRYWRSAIVQTVHKHDSPKTILDIGTGTGDLIFDILQNPPKKLGTLIGLDLSHPMLQYAQKKVSNSKTAVWIQANTLAIPLSSSSVDVVISAFVLRNIKKIIYNTFSEIYRVLKPGGSVLLLDMYAPKGTLLKVLHQFYLKFVLPVIGFSIFGRSWSGSYLSETILRFGQPEQLSEILKEAGFKDISYQPLCGGVAVIHKGLK